MQNEKLEALHTLAGKLFFTSNVGLYVKSKEQISNASSQRKRKKTRKITLRHNLM